MTKQIFYMVAIIILMIIAYRLMKKVKDVPEEVEDFTEQDISEEDDIEEEQDTESEQEEDKE
ncbi:hypothetical protein LJC06_04655 [Bacteroidales bacterium OttesenSCG-928-I14]|nr:hypothetical protein [Bacteroidales bacterium OttesenSCG-928-I14]